MLGMYMSILVQCGMWGRDDEMWGIKYDEQLTSQPMDYLWPVTWRSNGFG